jgi:hypothetical protein
MQSPSFAVVQAKDFGKPLSIAVVELPAIIDIIFVEIYSNGADHHEKASYLRAINLEEFQYN